MAAHRDIRIKFEIHGRQFEAVGFLGEGEFDVLGDEMLSRTQNENGGAIKGEDELYLRQRFTQLPQELAQYWLVTNERHLEDGRYISCFYKNNHGWYGLNNYFTDRCLVVRRCS